MQNLTSDIRKFKCSFQKTLIYASIIHKHMKSHKIKSCWQIAYAEKNKPIQLPI